MTMFTTCLIFNACTGTNVVEDGSEKSTLPELLDDCSSFVNETPESASGIPTEDGWTHNALRMCQEDSDHYVIDIPPGEWVSLEVTIDGEGDNSVDGTDIDMWEVENPNTLTDARLDMIDDTSVDQNLIWASATEQPFERLAWYNNSSKMQRKHVLVKGHGRGAGYYDLKVRTTDYHDGLDCNGFYEDQSESGPCNQIMQFPQANTVEDGYVVSHNAHYSSLRREVSYLVRYAAQEVARTFPGTNPIGLLDMGQYDGDTPGRDVNQLRHPEGTHVYGNDIDIAFYQTGDDNLGRPVCPSHDNYFCTGPATLLDAERTAYFLVKLMESPYMRVIGVDPKVAEAVFDAADDLQGEGLISFAERNKLSQYLAYGDGWPFHHHHLHFSWDWEDGEILRAHEPSGHQCGGEPFQPYRGWPDKFFR